MIRVRSIVGPVAALQLFAAGDLSAQRNLRDIPVPDPEAELKDFVVAEGFEVNLFADEQSEIVFDGLSTLGDIQCVVVKVVSNGETYRFWIERARST